MKTIKYISIIISTAALTWGCKFLEVEHLGKNDIPKFFSDVEGVRFAGQGIYSEFYAFYNSYYMKYSEVAADMVSMSVAMSDMKDQYNYTSAPDQEVGAPGMIWSDGYTVLANVNHLLHYAPAIKEKFPNSAAEIDNIMAQALFIRAAMHLFICNTYAQPYNFTANGSHIGIPVVASISGVNDRIMRSPVSAVYSRITEDLKAAIPLFGSYPLKGVNYASPLACKALLARVYLYMGDNEKARDYASEVIAAKPLTEGSDYLSMYVSSKDTYETIFRLSGKNKSHRLRTFYVAADNNVTVSNKFVETFYDENDLRKLLLDGRTSLKYAHGPDWNPAMEEENTFYAPIMLRTSEMYLIRAEAYCGLNQLSLAESDMKTLIGRALGKAPENITLAYATAAGMMDIIRRERILELSFEGHRFFDIIRYKQDVVRDDATTSTEKKITYPNYKFVLPLTNIEMGANKGIEQNPGY